MQAAGLHNADVAGLTSGVFYQPLGGLMYNSLGSLPYPILDWISIFFFASLFVCLLFGDIFKNNMSID